MAVTQTNQTTAVTPAPSKSFMTAGPTLHYSHAHVLRFWALAVVIYLKSCILWNLILTGGTVSISLTELANTFLFRLGYYVIDPVSIYEFPWQIAVLGILMGILAVTPVLVSQLLSFRYSILMILSVIFIAKLYLFGLFVLVSCIAVACRPLRFRSRFIAVALCMAPQLIYWAIWGGHPTVDPVRWGFSFSPWICAWLCGLSIAALVLGIGHFTRYKPGLIWSVSFLMLLLAFLIFQQHIGFAELDYQRNVADNNPEDVVEFHDNDVAAMIDSIIDDPRLRSFLIGRFYPTEPILLRQKLKDEIQSFLVYDRWPEWDWFRDKMPDQLKYQAKRRELITLYELFMERWSQSDRMPIALYYKAILNEYRPDIRHFGLHETLRFYSDYPFYDNLLIWEELFENFSQSPESLEARWRIAMHDAGKGDFEKANEMCQYSLVSLRQLDEIDGKIQQSIESDSIFAAFQEPQKTVMTPYKRRDLEMRFRRLQALIAEENRGQTEESAQRLATFVMLNPYSTDYESRLDRLLLEMDETDGLRDNVLLAKAMLMEDVRSRSLKLAELTQQYPSTDAGRRAMYELALAKVQMWKDPQNSEEAKAQLLAEVRQVLNTFIQDHSDSIFASQAESMLKTLPQLP